MNRRAWNWIVIVVVMVVAILNPWYRHSSNLPIVTLGLDLRGGIEVLLQAVPDASKPGSTTTLTDQQVSGCVQVVRNRVDPSGTKEIYITRVGQDRLLLQVPGEKNPDRVISVIGDTARLEFVNTGDKNFTDGTDFNQEGSETRKEDYAQYDTILSGADLEKSFPTYDQQNRPAIGFKFKTQGVADKKSAADTFGEFTNDHTGQFMTVLLDGKVLTSPKINGAIWGGDGIIEGSMDRDTVNKIVNQLNAGALPVPLHILSTSVVGPSLGQKSIDNSFTAGIVGFVIVMIFMVLFYRLPGLVANIALAMYVVLVLGFLSLINATLTLPGIAGFLLSVGMAIDANIIIFERLKEEIRWGKTLGAALEAAFARAWVAILDGHVTVLLGSAVLYFYGTGPVKGFAVTLFLGTIFALYSGVFVTRNLLELFIRQFTNLHLYAPHTEELEIPAERLARGHYFHFVERTGLWLTVSFVGVAIGIGFMFYNGQRYGHPFNLGIDFTGGDSIILKFKQELPKEGQAIADVVKKYSVGEPTVQVDAVDPHQVSIRMRFAGTTGSTPPAAPAIPPAAGATGATEGTPATPPSAAAPATQTQGEGERATADFIALKKDLGDAYGGYAAEGATDAAANPTVMAYNHVGPTVGAELIKNAIIALLLGSVLIFIYVLLRFSAWQFSLAAVLNILQDMLMLLAATAILGLEVNSSFIAVVLTIAGYSINDTIIIFDRIRENRRIFPPTVDLPQLANLSLTQTLGRSIYTVLTVLFMTVTLLIFGGPNLHDFMLAMFMGLVLGGFSSIRFATPLFLYFTRVSGNQVAGAPELATAGPSGGSIAIPTRPSAPAPIEPEYEGGLPPAPGSGGAGAAGSAGRPVRKQRRR